MSPLAPIIKTLFITLYFMSLLLIQSSAQTLLSPVNKENTTSLYTLLIYLKTPLQPSKLHLDLGSYLPVYDCAHDYNSSSYQPVYSNSTLCIDLDPKLSSNCFRQPGPGCANDSCGFTPENPVTRKIGFGDVILDNFAFSSREPSLVRQLLFSCTNDNKYSRIYRGLARGVKGLAALGRFNYSLPAQISHGFSAPQIFAVCLPSSPEVTGFALFNSKGRYYFSSGNELAKSFIYTPLILGPVGADTRIYYWYKSPYYYIGLTSIKVNGRDVPLNKTLLAIDNDGHGGTKISTSRPYTTLETSIFKALIDAFQKESTVLNLTLIKPIEPFSMCSAAENMRMSTSTGPIVPTIDLVLQSGEVSWRIYGSNSMVRVTNKDMDAWCLGIVDGGSSPRTSIVIGGHQIEDNLLHFDLEAMKLGFTSSLLFHNTSCANLDISSTL